ncbi:MAG: peptide-methionine (S)-S-oxide reductase MsrA [Alphaproteobacteria bacterium]|nr:peptide-methionine (S)-S-oxide reductase MsrA [Alphaproteobacteria bacterium]
MNNEKNEIALLAGGCFWCMESNFDEVPGVVKVISGYTGGRIENPTYEQVSTGETNYYEAVKIIFNPQKTIYNQLLEVFWHNIDPFDDRGQFGDKGPSYRAAIFYQNDFQHKKAIISKKAIEVVLKRPAVTDIIAASTFYPAEEHHQQYYKKNPLSYNVYRYDREERLEEIWGLTSEQLYSVNM